MKNTVASNRLKLKEKEIPTPFDHQTFDVLVNLRYKAHTKEPARY